jgi:outer membrane protein assembly factor BamA
MARPGQPPERFTGRSEDPKSWFWDFLARAARPNPESSRLRIFRFIFACVLLAMAVEARADAPKKDVEFTVLTPPAPPAIISAAPAVGDPPDLAAFAGRVITRVDAVLDDTTFSDVAPPALTSVRPGELVSAALVRRALDEALATGRFANGRVSVTREGPGARVVVHLTPRKLVHTVGVEVHGATLENDEVLREAEIIDGGELIGQEIPLHRARVEAYLMRRGYPRPVVTITTRPTDDPLRVAVLIDVAPGPPRTLARRVFYIIGGDSADLSRYTDKYAVAAGDRVDEIALAQADAQFEAFLRGRGWHHAEVSHDVILQSGFVTLRVRVDSGAKILPRFEGNDHYDADALTSALDLEEDTDRSPANLVRKLKEFYAKRGFLDAEVRFEARGGPNDRIHYLVFKIIEHPRVEVVARTYPCLKEDEIKGLSEGGPRSAVEIGTEIDSYLEEDLPGADFIRSPRASGVSDLLGDGKDPMSRGARVTPIDLDPNATYVPETYEKALAHVQELYRNEGFLNAIIGPAFVIRRRCDARSPAGQCVPVPLPKYPPDVCAYDAQNLPLPPEPPDASLTCVPDPAHGVECEPRVLLRVPVKLGPRTKLYDVGFSGPRAFSEKKLAEVAGLPLGNPVSILKLDEARRRLLDLYKEEGYAYADIKYHLDSSLDHTRGRATFDIAEGEQVIVRGIVIRGNTHTSPWVIRRRIALEVGAPFRESDRRKTRERIATLGTFSSVDVELEEPYLPQKRKMVIINVVERTPGYAVPAVGFSTGEGGRVSLEFGYGNIGGDAISLTLGARLSYLPTGLILDPEVKKRFVEKLGEPGFDARTGVRVTASLGFPEIGLGPLVRTQLDLLGVHDLQRDFYVTKFAVTPSINYRPINDLIFTASESVEYNNLRVLSTDNRDAYFQAKLGRGELTQDLLRYLLYPDGKSIAVAQRFVVTWDRRDNAFDPSRGTRFVSTLEHVDAFPQELSKSSTGVAAVRQFESHFLRLSETFGGYVPIYKKLRFAAELRLGTNIQLTSSSQTYPDRLFFMGGNDTMRGWSLNSFLPQDDADQIFADKDKPDCDPADPTCSKAYASTYPIRGGNLMANAKLELRIPIRGPVETVVFSDIGNLWVDPAYPFRRGRFPMRAAVGTGLRIQTPIAPIAADYGINVTREPYEDPGAFHLAIGLF